MHTTVEGMCGKNICQYTTHIYLTDLPLYDVKHKYLTPSYSSTFVQ